MPALLRRSVPLWVTLLLVAVAAAVAFAAISISPTEKTIVPYAEKYVADTKTTIVSLGLDVAASTESKTAAAQSSPGVDVTSSFPTVYANDITAGDLIFKFQFKELGVNTLSAAAVYRIRVWADNALKADIYVQQSSADIETNDVEGVTVCVDVGTSVSSITVIAEQTA
jgi:hypothetical protein